MKAQPLDVFRVGDRLDDVESFRLASYDVHAFSAQSPLKEPGENEDGAAVFGVGGTHAIIAVADGLGGHSAGDRASRIALTTVEESLRALAPGAGGVREAVLASFELANERVRALGLGAATTLVVAVIQGNRLRTYHVGDSGALVFGGRGRVKLQTTWHSPIGYALKAGLLDEAEALEHEDRHLISNVIGDESMHVEMSSELRLAPRDTVVVATDGLFDNFSLEEIVEGLRTGDLRKRLGVQVDACRDRMMNERGSRPSKPDDLTVVASRPGCTAG